MILSITDRICRYYSTLSGQPRERVLIDLDRDNFMDANEALAYGLVDQVLQKPTAKGELRIKLRPDWHAPSVTYVRTVALTDTCTAKCVLPESPHRPSRSKLAVTAPGRL